MRSLLLTLCIVLAFAGPSLAAPKADFPIRLHRPSSVGARGRLVVDGHRTEKTTTVANGKEMPVQSKDLRFHLESVEVVRSVDEKGNTVASEYLIERLEQVEASGARPLLQKGQVVKLVRAKTAEDTEVMIDGKPADKELRKAIGAVLTLRNSGGASDDERYGTTTRKPVGASWPVNSLLMEEELFSNLGTRASLTGTSTLSRKLVEAGTVCLEVQMTTDGIIKALPNLPEGATVKSGRIQISASGAYPVDVNRKMLRKKAIMSMDVELIIPAQGNRPALVSHAVSEEVRTGTYSPLPTVAGK